MSNSTPAPNAYGYEHTYQQYLAWVEKNADSYKKKALIALAISVVLVGVMSLPFLSNVLPHIIIAIVSFPAAILIFGVLLGFFYLRSLSSENYIPVRQKYTPRIRRRVVIALAFLLAIALITGAPFLPYAVGGTILLVCALALYNTMRRTPEEIALAEAGISDPRENTVKDETTPTEQD